MKIDFKLIKEEDDRFHRYLVFLNRTRKENVGNGRLLNILHEEYVEVKIKHYKTIESIIQQHLDKSSKQENRYSGGISEGHTLHRQHLQREHKSNLSQSAPI